MNPFKRQRRSGVSTTPKRDLESYFTRRAMFMSGAGLLSMGAIGARLVQLQATDWISNEYTEQADENRYDSRLIAPPRGVIYDRFGTPLAITSKDYRVSIIPERSEDIEGSVRTVAMILGFDEAWVRRKTREASNSLPRYEPVALKQGMTWNEFAAVNVRLPELSGVVAESTEVRSYPYDVVFAHPIGYVQKPNQRDIDRAIEEGSEGQRRALYYRNPDVRVGKAGVEASLENTLRGEAGWKKMIVNARGREMGEDTDARVNPRPGSGVVLTIDAELQRRAVEVFGDQSGGAVVMDIVTGDLLVMTSAPTFDPNLFVNGIGQAEFGALNTDEKKPLFNKSVSGGFPPGSTFKTMVGIAAKQAGIEDDWHVNCPGYMAFGGRNFHCWKRGGHGQINLHRALRESCDVFFYQAALRAGPERIAAVAHEFGFGVAHDVSVPNVIPGLVPDPTWWREHRHENWSGGLTLNYGIGQGSLLVTPLQLCCMAARIANNGKAVKPRLVREAPGVDVDPPVAQTMHNISPEHLAAVRQGMFGVCNEPGGTAMRAGNMVQCVRRPDGVIVDAAQRQSGWAPIQIAGKTGTSQVRIISAAERARGVIRDADLPWRMRDNALFVSFGPWDNPRYACAVVIEHGGHINPEFDASPIAAHILRETFLRDPANRAAARLAALDSARQGAPA